MAKNQRDDIRQMLLNSTLKFNQDSLDAAFSFAEVECKSAVEMKDREAVITEVARNVEGATTALGNLMFWMNRLIESSNVMKKKKATKRKKADDGDR